MNRFTLLEWLLIIIAAAVIAVIGWDIASSAEPIHYVRMQYSDEFDLGAKTQAFIAECDTTIIYSPKEYAEVVWNPDVNPDTISKPIRIITRQLIGVTVVEPIIETTKWILDERYPGVYLEGKRIDHPMMEVEIFIPGTALLWYREIVE